MSCAGLHCDGCRGGGGLLAIALAAAAGLGGAGAAVSWVLANITLIAVCALVSAGAVVSLMVRVVRRELHEHTWHGEARIGARVNMPAIPPPAPAPALTADQITGLAQLGHAIRAVRADGAGQRAAIVITSEQEIPR